MVEAKKEDLVKVNYTGRLADGTVFDSSEDSGPLEFNIGRGQVIPGFEEAVIGMQAGERKTVHIPPDQAYGEHHPQLVAVVERKNLPSEMDLVVGTQLEVTQENGDKFLVMISAVSDETVSLDANHPLAGKELIFDIHLVEIDGP